VSFEHGTKKLVTLHHTACNTYEASMTIDLSVKVKSNGLAITHNLFSICSERQSNGYIGSNDYISSSWKSTLCRCSDTSAKLQFCNSSCCKVSSRTSCKLTILTLFFLNFLAFFPVSFVSVILLPFRYLSCYHSKKPSVVADQRCLVT
jgi:hypothetical protein